jgi:hypothetical protein
MNMAIYYEKISLLLVVHLQHLIHELSDFGLALPETRLPVLSNHSQVGTVVVSRAEVTGLLQLVEINQGHLVVLEGNTGTAVLLSLHLHFRLLLMFAVQKVIQVLFDLYLPLQLTLTIQVLLFLPLKGFSPARIV